MSKSICLMLLAGLSTCCFLAACSGPASEELPQSATGEEAYQRFVSDGLSCGTKDMLLSLDDSAAEDFRTLVKENIPAEQRSAIIAGAESSCGAGPVAHDDKAIGTTHQAITGTWDGEWIEETYLGGGNTPSSLFRDSSSSSWMCNSGSPGSWYDPADWIAQVNVYGSYTNQSILRVYGVQACMQDAINGGLSARVYSDHDVRACIGYWSVWVECGTPATSYLRFGLSP